MSEIEFVTNSNVTLVQSNASDDMVAMAAWVSNGLNQEDRLQDRKKVAGLINFLWRNKHLSPFEHGQFTFLVDVPLFVAREWHRHRTMSYNEISGRYTEMQPRFYVPWVGRPFVQTGKIGNYQFEDGDIQTRQMLKAHIMENSRAAWNSYLALKERGVANEVARMVLPVNLMTQFYATVNPRNLLHFLSLRNDPQALYEIRQAAVLAENILSVQMPLTYAAYLTYTAGRG